MFITHKELVKLLKEKDVLVKEGRELTKQIEKVEAERNKIGLKIQKIKDKVKAIVDKEITPKLAEFEEIATAELKDDGVEFKISNVIEDFKKQWLEMKNKQETTK